MQTATTDVWEICKSQGTRAAYDALNRFLERPMRGWGRGAVHDLERWSNESFNAGVWPISVLCQIALLLVLKSAGEEEKRAYFFNDLGISFFMTLDRRCLICYHRALRLTKSPGRRMRTLRRVGRALALIDGDWVRARRWLRAALYVGERYRLKPEHIAWIKDELARPPEKWLELRREVEARLDPCLVHMLKTVDPGAF